MYTLSFKQDNGKNFPEWPVFDKEDIEILSETLKSGRWWAGSPGQHSGENIWKFQEEFASYQESKYCIAVANGTVAIEAALLALGIGMGDEVIVSDYTFVASASAVVATNAVPIFCDINPDTLVMDVDKVEDLITDRTEAIVPVHLGGNPVEMDKLMDIAERYDLSVVEDCAHAHGTRFKKIRAGNWGDVGTFSFQASKVLTSGEGGAIICNDDDLADEIYTIIDCGRKKNHYSYAHYVYGTNYRMSEFLAALLRTQLEKFPEQHKLRNENAEYFTEHLNQIDGIKAMKPTPGTSELGWYVYPIVYEPEKFNQLNKSEFYKKLNRNGIPTDDCYPPLHTLQCFKDVNLRKGIDYSKANWGGGKSDDKNFPVVFDVYSRSVEFPQYILLSTRDQLDEIVTLIKSLQ
ncbi:MAG: aminotransferase class I/II-fold pyridoxal phosphate-dependent enzyme [Candidatus Lokiarchaeota archaeon]|nr:aminotransferase class I/II-fold pyridoxal phosphate-dependent enzyme [Candidatus Lokiarchaeota archaeon]MBD3198439.1 aminotransferase class I/II-fold pyridoxal phosphate-dependent enzyme [Candidatus Lokiarchaeota archaeon]